MIGPIYCHLTLHAAPSFRDRSEAVAKRTVAFDDILYAVHPYSATDAGARSFDIVTSSRTFHATADTAFGMQIWIEVINLIGKGDTECDSSADSL